MPPTSVLSAQLGSCVWGGTEGNPGRPKCEPHPLHVTCWQPLHKPGSWMHRESWFSSLCSPPRATWPELQLQSVSRGRCLWAGVVSHRDVVSLA